MGAAAASKVSAGCVAGGLRCRCNWGQQCAACCMMGCSMRVRAHPLLLAACVAASWSRPPGSWAASVHYLAAVYGPCEHEAKCRFRAPRDPLLLSLLSLVLSLFSSRGVFVFASGCVSASLLRHAYCGNSVACLAALQTFGCSARLRAPHSVSVLSARLC